MKKTCAFLCIVLILLCLLPTLGLAQESINLIDNGGFELLDEENEPIDWSVSAYRTEIGYSRLLITDEKAHSGSYSALIENAASNDARYIHTVSVEPSSLYRLSGYILVDYMKDEGRGANLGIEDVYISTSGLYDTQNEWQYIEYYGETADDQTSLTFGVRVGGYSSESIGKAYFDDIVLEKVNAAPSDVIASLWYKEAKQSTTAVTPTEESEIAQKSTGLFIFCALALLLIFLFARPLLLERSNQKAPYVFAVLMLLALIVRVLVAFTVKGYEVDVNCFHGWSLRMAEKGPLGFYASDYFCDYPPGYMLLLRPIGLLLRAMGSISQPVLFLLLKLYPIIFDLLCAMVIYTYAKKHTSNVTAIVLSMLFALNPVAIVNGAAWGQVDSVLALFLILVVIYAMDRKWRVAVPLFFIAVLLKPQALLFGPMACVWMLVCLVDKQAKAERTRQLKDLAIGFAIGIAAAVAIIVPFAWNQDNPWTWIFDLYKGTLSSYAHATLNTANLYYLLAANWTSVTVTIGRGAPLVTALVMGALGIWLIVPDYITNKKFEWKNKKGIIGILSLEMMLVQLIFVGISPSYEIYGFVMMAYIYLFAAICLFFDKESKHLPFYLALVLIGIYVLGIKVHERYLFAALPLLLISYLRTKDIRMLWIFVWFSMTTFINTAIVLDNSMLYGAAMGHLNDDTLAINCVLAMINMAACIYAGWIAINGFDTEQEALEDESEEWEASDPKPINSYEQMLLHPKDARMHLKPKDWLIMGIVTVLYSVLTFTNLGSTVAPQDGWISTSSDEQIVFELDGMHDFSLMYYAGVSHNDFSVSVSEDGERWSEPFQCEMKQGLCYRWLYLVSSEVEEGKTIYAVESEDTVLWLTGKYLRINAESPGLNLFEIVAVDDAGEPLALVLVDHIGANPDMVQTLTNPDSLINEQDSYTGAPSWFNGTYFDEIYHARTAYEHLHGTKPYETTHPPLGKLLMSAAIAIFGMTPFGWRFAGALVGVLMLPGLYLLALQLTKRRDIATVSMLAFTFDLMHFTQTRIATIDSFPVFFIILSFICLMRYLQTDLFAIPEGEKPQPFNRTYWRSLISLALGGVFMGLSIASKWIGIYSALGLAALFFIAVYRQYRVSNIAYGMDAEDETLYDENTRMRIKGAQEYTLKRILTTCGFCVVFFILIPCIIYYLCYIPYLAPTGPVTIQRVIDEQIGMLNYHGTPGLGMDHPYQSPWWKWPLILKPMWFNQDKFEPEGFASTIFCMGNPWVFYIGAACMLAVLILFVRKYIRFRHSVELRKGDGDLTLMVIVIGFLAQYLPWVLVPRGMYMYHYFASVPFIVLATAWLLGQIPEERKELRTIAMILYVHGAIAFFIMFFPYASGALTSKVWLDAVKWFPGIWY